MLWSAESFAHSDSASKADWPCLSFPSPRTRSNMMPLFRRFLPFFLHLQRSGSRKPGKCEVRNNNSAELRNQQTYEAYKQFHFCEATSNCRIVSLLWHLGDNKRSKQPKKLPPFPFFCKSSIKYYSEIIILTGSPHQVGNFVMGREVGQGIPKYLKISCSYVLKSKPSRRRRWPSLVLPRSCSIATIGNYNWMS